VAFPIYADENAQSRALVKLLVHAGIECLTANDAATNGWPDGDQLAFAAGRGYVILTHDSVDFQRLHSEWSKAGREHAGVIIVTDNRMPTSLLFTRLMALQSSRSPETMRNAILFVAPTTAEGP